jgi:hypothetical protein
MPRIKLLSPVVGSTFSYPKGRVVEWADEEDAKRMVDAGVAEFVLDPEGDSAAKASKKRIERADGRRGNEKATTQD